MAKFDLSMVSRCRKVPLLLPPPPPRRDAIPLHVALSTVVNRRPDQNYKAQRLLLGTHTNDNEPNYLQIATVQLPMDLDKVDTRKYEENTNGKYTYHKRG